MIKRIGEPVPILATVKHSLAKLARGWTPLEPFLLWRHCVIRILTVLVGQCWQLRIVYETHIVPSSWRWARVYGRSSQTASRMFSFSALTAPIRRW